MNEEALNRLRWDIAEMLKPLSDYERRVVLGHLCVEYCQNCGRYHGDDLRRCQCNNDE